MSKSEDAVLLGLPPTHLTPPRIHSRVAQWWWVCEILFGSGEGFGKPYPMLWAPTSMKWTDRRGETFDLNNKNYAVVGHCPLPGDQPLAFKSEGVEHQARCRHDLNYASQHQKYEDSQYK